MIAKEKVINYLENGFSILHLSDLHIVRHAKDDCSTVLHRMIDHIYNITEEKHLDKIIIVFTGDLVEKGNFSDTKNTIKKFFVDMLKKLGEKVIDIVFAPGNHDKKRGVLELQEKFDEGDEKFWSSFKEKDWKYFDEQFEDYKEVVNNIQSEVFHKAPQYEESYGVKTVHINGYQICFLCMNSAWSSMGENDEGHLRLV